MYLFEMLAQFFREMRTRKMRTFLAAFGIAWGTAAVVLLLALGGGFHDASRKAMHGMGENILIIWPSTTTKPFEGMRAGRAIRLRSADVIQLGKSLPEIQLCSPELNMGSRTLETDKNRFSTTVTGVVPEYESLRNMFPQSGGRFLDVRDVEFRRRVIFLGNDLKNKLFGQQKAIGRTVQVDGRPFLVIGILRSKLQNSSYAGRDADRAFIPYTTFIAIWGDRTVSDFIVRPQPGLDSGPVKTAIYRYLGRKFRFDPTDEGTLFIWDTVEIERFTDWFFWGLQALLGLGGALTLGAGGMGVANVMFLMVQERTREIGVRMAVGAREWHIMLQVLLETALIVGLGGAAGFLFSVLVVFGIHHLPVPKWLGSPQISPTVLLAAFATLALVGFISGIFPARRAARMDPVKALGF